LESEEEKKAEKEFEKFKELVGEKEDFSKKEIEKLYNKFGENIEVFLTIPNHHSS